MQDDIPESTAPDPSRSPQWSRDDLDELRREAEQQIRDAFDQRGRPLGVRRLNAIAAAAAAGHIPLIREIWKITWDALGTPSRRQRT
jgi:hypothetical protein